MKINFKIIIFLSNFSELILFLFILFMKNLSMIFINDYFSPRIKFFYLMFGLSLNFKKFF